MQVVLEEGWNTVLKPYLDSEGFKKMWDFIKIEYKSKTVFPKQDDIFNALNMTPLDKISVVIIGQDPYHAPGQAHGLSFSVPGGTTPPPSLKNIYKEIESDLRIGKDFKNGNLTPWSQQGVLLLNSILTVEENNPGSHSKKGWEKFTDHVIQKISNEQENIVFLLWGNYAQKKGLIIDRSKHFVLESSHPSPLGAYRGFIGCKHFSQTNKYLEENNKIKIEW